MTQTAVEFDPPTRIHIAIASSDVKRSVLFYETLFGQAPTKLRPEYAKFEIADPPVNFTVNQASGVRGHTSPAHFGIQVKSTKAVQHAQARLQEAGIPLDVEESVTCCYSVQDKFWATDPDGHRWEFFVVLDADAPVHSIPATKSTESPCCEPTCCK